MGHRSMAAPLTCDVRCWSWLPLRRDMAVTRWANSCPEQIQNPSDLRQSLLRGDELSLIQDQLAIDFEARIFVDDINVAWRFDIAADRIA